MAQNTDTTLLEEKPVGRPSRTPLVGGMTAQKYARIGSGAKPAVVKMLKPRRGREDALDLARYMTRGKEKVKFRDQEQLVTGKELEAKIGQWANRFQNHRRSRDVYHLMVSSPAGTKDKPFRDALDEFLKESFPEQDYAYSVHEPDGEHHRHAHIAIEALNTNRKKMRIPRGQTQVWREVWTEKAREQGINIESSRRYERGETERVISRAVRHKRSRGEVTEFDLRIEQEARARGEEPTEYETQQKELKDQHNTAALTLAKEFGESANDESKSAGERAKAREMSQDLRGYVQNTPEPVSDRERVQEQDKSRDRGR